MQFSKTIITLAAALFYAATAQAKCSSSVGNWCDDGETSCPPVLGPGTLTCCDNPGCK